MVRITIHTINKVGAPRFPLKCHVLRFPVICSMKDADVQAEVENFTTEHPDRTVIEWKKDILYYTPEQEAIEMESGQKPEPEYVDFGKFDQPL